jgi:hypothetical protein
MTLPKFKAKPLAKLLAGESQCRWAAWFLSTHEEPPKKEDAESESRLAQWTIAHNELLGKRAGILRVEGYKVLLEEANAFTVQGRTAIVTGKPDLVAINQNQVLIEDMKTGKRRSSDHAQVGVYMLLTGKSYEGKAVWGNVVYPDEVIPVKPLAVEHLTKLIASLLVEPTASPSHGECRWCPLTDCPHRLRGQNELKETDLF